MRIIIFQSTILIFLLLFYSVTVKGTDLPSNLTETSFSMSDNIKDLTVSYWGYQTSFAETALLNDGDSESGICKMTVEVKRVTILWSAICWGGGTVEIEVPCEPLNINEL